jgi:hypothetical protein
VVAVMGQARSPRGRVASWLRRAGLVTRSQVRRLEALLDAQSAELQRLNAELADTRRTETARDEEMRFHVAAINDRLSVSLRSGEQTAGIAAVAGWIAHQPLRTRPLVTVVLPTRDRPELLRRAIDSVRTQRYEHWELLVVDDSGTEQTHELVAEFGDERIRWLSSDRGGVCDARNRALAEATGTLVAYLDDDNLMDCAWLQAIAWAFETYPDADVLYGAFVIDDPARLDGSSGGGLPQTFLHQWEPGILARGNVADIGAIAHRAGLPEARFDPDLWTMGDWDLLVRLTGTKAPLVLPAVACYYTTDAPDRLTLSESLDADRQTVLRRAGGESAP